MLECKIYQIQHTFKEIKYEDDFSARDYIICYYLFPKLNFGYNELISSILNNNTLKNIDNGKLNVDDLLKDKNNIEKRIIESLVKSMISSLKYTHEKNYTGIFGVLPSRHKGLWVYVDLVKAKYLGWNTMYAESLDDLKSIVEDEGLLWYVFDNDSKKKSEEDFDRLNK